VCVQDLEEEEDLRAMESRGRTLNREDFHTDEQYQAYKLAKEAAPKAAFQFGVKVSQSVSTDWCMLFIPFLSVHGPVKEF
jgi:hypothetical protein